MNILIIDDEPDIVQLLKSVLEMRHHHVTTTLDIKGANHIKKRSRPIDFIVCDYGVQKASVVSIKQLFPTTPTLLISGYPVPEDEQLEYEIGFLQKPFGIHDLLEKLP